MRKLIVSLFGLTLLFTFHLAQAITPNAHKKWTFLIYLNGDNNLDSFGTKNLIDMEKVGSDDQVNIVVQWASLARKTSQRLLIKKSNDPTKVTSPVLEDLGLVDMGDYHSLQDFVSWGVKNFPADHYFVNVWDHGSGWHLKQKGNANVKQNTLNDISWDEISGNHITTEELATAINYAASVIGHPVDIYGSDACLMAMVEVANQMSPSVQYYVGSQTVEPANGWPYSQLLSRWEALKNAKADQISSILTEEYVKSYEGGSGGTSEVTFSAYRMDKLYQFNRAFKKLSYEIRKLGPEGKSEVLKAADGSVVFMEDDYRDAGDFLIKLKQAQTGIPVGHINQVQAALKNLVIANADTPTMFKNATGLSIWFPQSTQEYKPYADRYSNLEFNKETQWGDTLGSLLQGTH